MKSEKDSSYQKDYAPLKEKKTSDLEDSFDWDWIIDREWLRTKK